MKPILFLASVATLVMGSLFPNPVDSGLDGHTAALYGAKSLTVSFTVMKSGEKQAYTLSYSKSASFRIESPTRLTLSDGKTVWDLNKKDNTYTESPADAKRTLEDDAWIWAAFFNNSAFKDATNIVAGSKHSIKGVPVQDFSMDLPKGRSAILFIDAATGYARGGSVKSGDTESLVVATDIKLGTDPLSDSTFAFVAPDGAKKVEKPVAPVADYAAVDKIFQANCMPCHGAANSKGGLNLSSYKTLMMGGGSGPAIVAGDPDNSYLIKTLKGTASPNMPKGAGPLSADTIKTIEDWVKAGAKGP